MSWSMKKYTMEQEIPLSKEKVWDLLADTDHLNRIIGLFPVSFSPAIQKDGNLIYRKALAKVANLVHLKWVEYPFQWIQNDYYVVERKYTSGPLSRFIGGVKLLDSEKALKNGIRYTRVQLFAEFTPAHFLGVLMIPIVGKNTMNKTYKYLSTCLELQANQQKMDKPQQRSNDSINTSRLNSLRDTLQLQPVIKSYIPLLCEHLSTKGADEVVDMRPNVIARQWEQPQSDVLRLFLYATKVGMLNLSWNLMCPKCRVSKSQHNSLTLLKEQFHCDLCGIDYKANFDQFVELRFSVHPSIRKASHDTYCIGGPMITPHVLVQHIIKSGDQSDLYCPFDENKLRMRVIQRNHIVEIKRQHNSTDNATSNLETSENLCVYNKAGWDKPSLTLPESPQTITIDNQSHQDIVVVVEKIEWDDRAVTAAQVTAMQEFRRLFSSEVLAPGQQIGIESITILFSDLRGSTSMYEDIGDASAYGKVTRHFDYLSKYISEHSGSIVKTMGDAVMAVFSSPEDAVAAAIQIQQNLKPFNASLDGDIVIKLGIHTGPAIAVHSDDHLDYFGRTINIAARIQSESKGGDIVLSQAVAKQQQIQHLLKKNNVTMTEYQTIPRGFEENIDLVRIDLLNWNQN